MNITSSSVNIQKKDLIEHAVRLLIDSEKYGSSNSQHAAVALAQGYLRAAELMTESEHIVYIDLGERFVPQ